MNWDRDMHWDWVQEDNQMSTFEGTNPTPSDRCITVNRIEQRHNISGIWIYASNSIEPFCCIPSQTGTAVVRLWRGSRLSFLAIPSAFRAKKSDCAAQSSSLLLTKLPGSAQFILLSCHAWLLRFFAFLGQTSSSFARSTRTPKELQERSTPRGGMPSPTKRTSVLWHRSHEVYSFNFMSIQSIIHQIVHLSVSFRHESFPLGSAN